MTRISPEVEMRCYARMMAAKAEQHESLIIRLRAAVEKHGPESIYAELLAEAVAR